LETKDPGSPGRRMKGLLFTYALTYGGAVAALFDPFAGLLIYIAWAILRPESLWFWSVPAGGNYSRTVAIGLMAGWALAGFGNWQFGRAKLTVTALLCFFGWSMVCAMFAVADSGLAWMQVEEYSKVVLPFLVGITTVRTVQQIKQMAWVIVLCQGYLALNFHDIYYFSPFWNPDVWNFGGLDRNGIAVTMVTTVGVAGFLGLYARNKWHRLLALVCAALFSLSRGGMMGLLITGLIAIWLIPKKPEYIALMAIGLAVAIRLAGQAVIDRFDSSLAPAGDMDYSAESRVELWKACFGIMLQHPIVGIGPQNWRLVAHLYGFTPGKDAHTTWLHVGAEMGFVGLGFLVLFYCSCLVGLYRIWNPSVKVSDPWLRYFSHMVIAAIVGFAVSCQFVSVFGIEIPFYVILLGCCTLLVVSRENGEVEDSRSPEELAVAAEAQTDASDEEVPAEPAAAY
jgi:O-antigen ligase